VKYPSLLSAEMMGNKILASVVEVLEAFAEEFVVTLLQSEIAFLVNVSERTIRKHCEWLERHGFIRSVRRNNERGHKISNAYVLEFLAFPTLPTGSLQEAYRKPSSHPRGSLEERDTSILKDFISLSQKNNLSFEIPLWLDQAAWGDWQDYLLEKFNIVLTATQMKVQLELLLGLSEKEPQQDIIKRAISSGWKSFYPNHAKLRTKESSAPQVKKVAKEAKEPPESEQKLLQEGERLAQKALLEEYQRALEIYDDPIAQKVARAAYVDAYNDFCVAHDLPEISWEKLNPKAEKILKQSKETKATLEKGMSA
jgi:DNA-binding Lrp family transcriptional regulator